MKDASIRGFVISHATTDELSRAAASINRLLAEKRLRPRVTEKLPLSAAREAHIRMERGELHGKRLVLLTELTEEGVVS
jgi:NADPH:quinone reductase-like Zn-dependent oxidoreductase